MYYVVFWMYPLNASLTLERDYIQYLTFAVKITRKSAVIICPSLLNLPSQNQLKTILRRKMSLCNILSKTRARSNTHVSPQMTNPVEVTEWSSWSERCRVNYSRTGSIGAQGKGSIMVHKTEVAHLSERCRVNYWRTGSSCHDEI
jgi:hypothetical protein